MELREYHREDLPAIATILHDAFDDDPFMDTLAPQRHKYPELTRRWWLERTKLRLAQPGIHGIVVVHEDEIVGFAMWMHTSSRNAGHTTMIARLEAQFLKIQEAYSFHVMPNPAFAREELRDFRRSAGTISNPAFEDHWTVYSLVVAPKCQRRGIGGMLLQWGSL